MDGRPPAAVTFAPGRRRARQGAGDNERSTRMVRSESTAQSTGEGVEELAALLIAQATHPAGLTDSDLFHGPPCLHLADARQRLEDRQHLHLRDDILGVRELEELLQVDRAHLELLLQLGALTSRRCRFVERGLTLLR